MRRPFTLKSVFRKSTSAHILSVDARDLCRRRWQSSHAAEPVRSWHTSAADMIAPFLAIETCPHVLHDSSSGAVRPPDTPDCRDARRVDTEPGRPGSDVRRVRFEGETSPVAARNLSTGTDRYCLHMRRFRTTTASCSTPRGRRPSAVAAEPSTCKADRPRSPVQPRSVPHSCHTKGTTAVMSSHSKALQTASELGSSRSALTVKCPPNTPTGLRNLHGWRACRW
jgi:hypothetical protein